LPPSCTTFSAAWVATLPEPEMTAVLPSTELPTWRQHVLQEVDRAIAGRLRADQRAAIFQALAGQHARELVGDALILAEHVADSRGLRRRCRRPARRCPRRCAIKLGHEALAEAHHFGVALALRVEVGAALAAAHRKAGQRVLEGLLEGQELQHRLGHGRVEADAALVRADRIVVLDAPAALHADIVVVVLPDDAERHHSIRLGDAAQDLIFVIERLILDELEDILRHLLHRLCEFRLAWIAALHAFHEAIEIDML
jgi:hypothetical protein